MEEEEEREGRWWWWWVGEEESASSTIKNPRKFDQGDDQQVPQLWRTRCSSNYTLPFLTHIFSITCLFLFSVTCSVQDPFFPVCLPLRFEFCVRPLAFFISMFVFCLVVHLFVRVSVCLCVCVFNFDCVSFLFLLLLSFKYLSLPALVSFFNRWCFLRTWCSMEMWCLDDVGRDGWDWVLPLPWERARFNSPEWGGSSSLVKTELPQIGFLLSLSLSCWFGCVQCFRLKAQPCPERTTVLILREGILNLFTRSVRPKISLLSMLPKVSLGSGQAFYLPPWAKTIQNVGTQC